MGLFLLHSRNVRYTCSREDIPNSCAHVVLQCMLGVSISIHFPPFPPILPHFPTGFPHFPPFSQFARFSKGYSGTGNFRIRVHRRLETVPRMIIHSYGWGLDTVQL